MLLNESKSNLDKDNKCTLNKKISLSENEIQSVRVVYEMFKNMNISTSGAVTLVNILCSDKTLTDEMRCNLVDLYHRYTRLCELANANADFNQDIIKTNLEEVKLQLQLYLMKLMPINNECVEHDIAELQLELDKQLRKRDMLTLSQGIINEMCVEDQNIAGRLAIPSTPHKFETTKKEPKSFSKTTKKLAVAV